LSLVGRTIFSTVREAMAQFWATRSAVRRRWLMLRPMERRWGEVADVAADAEVVGIVERGL
jgi:hypothetical protein